MRPTTEPTVTASPAVLAPAELADRIEALRRTIVRRSADAADAPPLVGSTAVRARRLHEMWWSVAPPSNAPGRSVRSRLGHEVRRVAHRATGWSFEPRLVAQREIDAEIARFATDVSAALAEAHTELERLAGEVEHLRRELATAQRHSPESAADGRAPGATA